MDDLQKNEKLRQAILTVIEQQIETQNPPETAKTIDRLINDDGLTREKALQLVGYIVGYEVLDLFQQGRKYNETEYIKRLQALPALPWSANQEQCQE